MFQATGGTLINLLPTASMAYALASQHLRFRRFFLMLVLIPILFGPGMIPNAISAFNLIVMRNFFLTLPQELYDAAELDGSNDLQILWRIVLLHRSDFSGWQHRYAWLKSCVAGSERGHNIL